MLTLCPYIEIDDLLIRAAGLFHLPIKAITGPSRTRRVTAARFAVAYVARQAGHSLEAIGAALGGRDHTTIMNAERKAMDYAALDTAYAARLVELAK